MHKSRQPFTDNHDQHCTKYWEEYKENKDIYILALDQLMLLTRKPGLRLITHITEQPELEGNQTHCAMLYIRNPAVGSRKQSIQGLQRCEANKKHHFEWRVVLSGSPGLSSYSGVSASYPLWKMFWGIKEAYINFNCFLCSVWKKIEL